MNENFTIKECESIPKGGENPSFFTQDEKNTASELQLIKGECDPFGQNQQRLLTQARDSISIDPSSALEVAVNTNYQVSIPPNTMFLVKVNTGNIKKLTAVAQTNNDTKFETYLFTYDENTKEMTAVASSTNIFSTSDTLSFLPKSGWYYVLIKVLSGDRILYFRLQTSDSYSGNEPNDNPYQVSTIHSEYIRSNDSFDNNYDVDCSLLNITDPTITMYITMLLSNRSGAGDMKVYIVNMSEGYMEASVLLSVPTYGVTWNPSKAGLYCIYLMPATTSILNQEYSMLIAGENCTAFSPSHIYIGGIRDVDDGGYLFGSGKVGDDWWVCGSAMTLSGVIEGIQESSPIRVQITGKDDTTQRMVMSKSQSGLSFYEIAMLLPKTYGQDGTLSGYLGPNGYDLQPIRLFDFRGKQISCVVSNLYNVLNK